MLTYDDVQYILNSRSALFGPVQVTIVLLTGDEFSFNRTDCQLEDHYMVIGSTYIPYSAIAFISL